MAEGRQRGAGAVESKPAQIDIRIERGEQLFDSLDPSPFREKALDVDFEAYLRDCAGEQPSGLPLRLCIEAPPELQARAADVESAIHGHFHFALQQSERRHRASQRRYRGVVLAGFAVLAVSLTLRRLLEDWQGAFSEVLVEGLLVLGWVALWRPIEVLLFERHEARQQRQLLARLAAIEIVWRPRVDGAHQGKTGPFPS